MSSVLSMHINKVAVRSIALKLVTTAASITQMLFLVTLLTKEDFGRFSSIFAQITIFTVLCLQGSRQLLVRERISDLKIDGFFAIVINISFLITAFLYKTDSSYGIYFKILLFLNINIVFLSVILKSNFQILKSQLYLLLKPVLMVSVIYFLSFEYNISLDVVLTAAVLALTLVLMYYIYSVVNIINLEYDNFKQMLTVPYFTKQYKKIPIFLVNGASQVTYTMMPILLLTYNESFSEIAEYRVAERFAEVISYGLVAISAIISPLAALHFSNKNIGRLKRDIAKINRVNLAYQLVAVLAVLLFGEFLIENLLGVEYIISSDLLIILTVGQMASSTIGPVSILLAMSKNEVILMNVTLVFLAVSLVGGYFLVDSGLYSLAIFYSVSYTMLNIVLAGFLYRETKIMSFALR